MIHRFAQNAPQGIEADKSQLIRSSDTGKYSVPTPSFQPHSRQC